jgi:uncharacterized delta-60 repeat protein
VRTESSSRLIPSGILVALLLAACGGGGSTAPPSTGNPPPPPPGIGTAGGTVNGPSGAKVVIPAGALASNVDIAIAESSTGSPAIPGSLTAAGSIYAFTPHGTAFASAVTVTIPFDPNKVPAGVTPTLYKTNATQTAWERVAGATVSGNMISGQVTGFSFFVSAIGGFEDEYTFFDISLDGWHENGPIDSSSKSIDVQHGGSTIDLTPAGVERVAKATVHVSDSGEVYWATAVAPRVDYADPHSTYGYQSLLIHARKFRKTEPNATMHLVITQMTTELMDGHAQLPTAVGCPVLLSGGTLDDCENVLFAGLQFKIDAWRLMLDDTHFRVLDPLAHGNLLARSRGWLNHWRYSVGDIDPFSNLVFLTAPSFKFEDDVDHSIGEHARLKLDAPIVIDIPLDKVADEEEFYVGVTAISQAENRRGGDAFAGAWFRDPQESGGVEGVSYEGDGFVEETVVSQTEILPPVIVQTPAPSCPTGTDPAAGTIQFENASTRVAESAPGGDALIGVTRIGGSTGEITALFTTSDGDGVAGRDYGSVSTLVRFADGASATRFVPVPVLDNHEVNDTRNVSLQLSDARGCGALGSPAAATLTILDDDRVPTTAPAYLLGGTVSGLVGSGLSLREIVSGATLAVGANGAFTFAEALASGVSYDVRVDTQPGSPLQNCTVANGAAVVGTTDITNIAVTCTTPLPTGSLDPAFGGGKIASTSAAATSVALQSDGKSVVVGGKTLSRFNTDGSPDATFGTAGKVTIVSNGGSAEGFEGVAVQSDGKIVVAGHTSIVPSLVQDFTVQRFNADGTLDASFGTGGKVVTDFSGTEDIAYALALQPDGKILVAGTTVIGSGVSADQDIGIARYLADGTLDSTFGTSGKQNTNIAGPSDFGYSVAVQTDGRIVVGGRVAINGGSDPDFGLVRYTAQGQPDATFGTLGTVRVAFANNTWDEIEDVTIQADGKILAAGFARSGSAYQFALMRFNTDGTVDVPFGVDGRFISSLSTRDNFGRAVAVDSAGRILIAGQVSSLANGDFGVVRLASSGAIDSSFGTAGFVTVDFFGTMDNARDLAIQADGNILVVGWANNGGVGLAMARIIP